MDKIKTGIPGLDQILEGGIPCLSTILVAGVPGSGKTILTQNILFNINKEYGSNVLYLSTVSEPQIKVIRYQQQFTFFSQERFMESVFFQDIGSEIRKSGIKEALTLIENLIKKFEPSVIVIDSFKAVGDYFSNSTELREFITELNLILTLSECTVFLVGEYFEEELKSSPEAAIVDGILYLYGTEERKMQKRFMRILKMRGTGFWAGEHIIEISDNGVAVFPRLKPAAASSAAPSPNPDLLQATGVAELDSILEGGIPAGSTTFVTGATGTGKTLLALKWLVEGAKSGEAGFFITFNESPDELISMARVFGWDPDYLIKNGLLTITHVPPVEFDIDRHVYNAQMTAIEKKVKRLVIDSISTFEIGITDKVKFTDYVWGITNFFKQEGISQMLLNESRGLFEIPPVSRHYLSHIADNIIFFRYIQHNYAISRLIGVLKMRGKKHRNVMREFKVTDEGPDVLAAKKEKAT